MNPDGGDVIACVRVTAHVYRGAMVKVDVLSALSADDKRELMDAVAHGIGPAYEALFARPTDAGAVNEINVYAREVSAIESMSRSVSGTSGSGL